MSVPKTSIAERPRLTMIRYSSPKVSVEMVIEAATSATAKTSRLTASFCRSASRTVTQAMAADLPHGRAPPGRAGAGGLCSGTPGGCGAVLAARSGTGWRWSGPRRFSGSQIVAGRRRDPRGSATPGPDHQELERAERQAGPLGVRRRGPLERLGVAAPGRASLSCSSSRLGAAPRPSPSPSSSWRSSMACSGVPLFERQRDGEVADVGRGAGGAGGDLGPAGAGLVVAPVEPVR